jgi:opacity protein-like surface antigen
MDARRLLILALMLTVMALARPAAADLTGFIGATTTPTTRLASGVAVGFSLLIVGFEFEYSRTGEAQKELAPSLGTGMFNVLLQTPFPIARTQFYATAGAGAYRERLGDLQETNFGVNIGGGAKITLAGPLRLRLDYRLFKLQGSAIQSRPQRLYAGVNLAF